MHNSRRVPSRLATLSLVDARRSSHRPAFHAAMRFDIFGYLYEPAARRSIYCCRDGRRSPQLAPAAVSSGNGLSWRVPHSAGARPATSLGPHHGSLPPSSTTRHSMSCPRRRESVRCAARRLRAPRHCRNGGTHVSARPDGSRWTFSTKRMDGRLRRCRRSAIKPQAIGGPASTLAMSSSPPILSAISILNFEHCMCSRLGERALHRTSSGQALSRAT